LGGDYREAEDEMAIPESQMREWERDKMIKERCTAYEEMYIRM